MEDRLSQASSKTVLYNSLARAMNYPDEEIASEIVAGKFATELAAVLQGPLRNIAETLSVYRGGAADSLLLELERDYTWMFFASKPRIAYLFGSVYGEGKLYQESTFAITRLYYEAGLSLNESFKLPPDHIAVELEFMAYLAYNEMEAIRSGNAENEEYALEVQETVWDSYLQPLAFNIGERIAGSAKTEFYRTTGRLLKAISAAS
jgi:TorA maturation chaperone TorD